MIVKVNFQSIFTTPREMSTIFNVMVISQPIFVTNFALVFQQDM